MFLQLPHDIQFYIYDKFLDKNDRANLNISLTNKNLTFMSRKKKEAYKHLGIISKALQNQHIEMSPKIKHFIKKFFEDDEMEKKSLIQTYPFLAKSCDKSKQHIIDLIHNDQFDEMDMIRIISSSDENDKKDLSDMKKGRNVFKMSPTAFDIAFKYISKDILSNWSWIFFMVFSSCNINLMEHLKSKYPEIWKIELLGLSHLKILMLGNHEIASTLCEYFIIPIEYIENKMKKTLELMLMDEYSFYQSKWRSHPSRL